MTASVKDTKTSAVLLWISKNHAKNNLGKPWITSIAWMLNVESDQTNIVAGVIVQQAPHNCTTHIDTGVIGLSATNHAQKGSSCYGLPDVRQ
jgi:hypothetical protein